MDAPIPVLTLEDTEECSRALLAAACDYGFVYLNLKNCPIAPSDVDRCFDIVCSPTLDDLANNSVPETLHGNSY